MEEGIYRGTRLERSYLLTCIYIYLRSWQSWSKLGANLRTAIRENSRGYRGHIRIPRGREGGQVLSFTP